MSFKYVNDEALEQQLAECVERARELKGKKSPAARRQAQANSERFTEITRELKRRKENVDG